MARSTRKWYQAAKRKHSGWRKSQSQATRISHLLRAHKSTLSAARSAQALANVTRDPETKRKARADARLLFARYRQSKSRKRKRR